MNSRTLAKPKNQNSTTFSPIFGKKVSNGTFTPESANEARDASNPGFGHNFGNVQVESQSFKNSCSLSLSNPSQCPYGGACHTCPPRIQAKLKIGTPGDKYEQEADRVAEQVMRMPDPQSKISGQVSGKAESTQIQKKCAECEEEEDKDEVIQTKPLANSITPLIQRQAENEEDEEEEILQGKEMPGQTPTVTPEVSTKIDSMRGGGQLLPETERAFFEPRFGYDFSQVRVHTDARATNSARMLNSLAYTVGNNIVFQAGSFVPMSRTGKELLAHELTHVIQQTTLVSHTPRFGVSAQGTLEQNVRQGGNQTSGTQPVVQRRAIYRGQILDEGSCEHLACNSRWACEDDTNGITCPDGTRNAHSVKGHDYRPLFTCDVKCENNRTCSDNANWMAIPRSRFARRKCNQDLVICANNSFTHASVRDRSHVEAWEVGHGVQDELGISPYATFNGSIYGGESDSEFLKDGLCR